MNQHVEQPMGEYPDVSREDVMRGRRVSTLLEGVHLLPSAREAVLKIAAQPEGDAWLGLLELARRIDAHERECGGTR